MGNNAGEMIQGKLRRENDAGEIDTGYIYAAWIRGRSDLSLTRLVGTAVAGA